MKNSKKSASTWTFDQGVLTINHSGTIVSLGRYANHEFAAKAAELYIADHPDGVEPMTTTSGK
ncbi:MAG TPA: hypothetical protein VIJ78_07165 [Pseudolabrys sp.]